MRKTFMAAALLASAGLSGLANAADVYSSAGLKDSFYAPVNSWSGFYFGVNGGYAEANDKTNITSYVDGAATQTTPGFDSKGAFAGGQAGMNWQRGMIVYGLETDLQGASVKTGSDISGPIYNRHLTQSVDWFGTVRGRVGYAFDNALVYVTGGFAYAGMDSSIDSTLPLGFFNSPVATWGKSAVETGYAVGGGVEYKPVPAWSFKVEYQYIDLGSYQLSGYSSIGPITSNSLSNNFSIVRMGINFHPTPAYEPLK